MRAPSFTAALILALIAGAASSLGQTSQARPGRVAPGLASSTCIGTATTPVCAAETLLACIARADAQLCQRVGIADPRTAVGQPPALVEYFIERSSIIRREDIPEDLGDVDWYKPGYALVEIQRRSCQPGKPNCAEESWTDLQVYARPRGNLWDIVTWRSEAGDESAPDLPDAFNTPRPRR